MLQISCNNTIGRSEHTKRETTLEEANTNYTDEISQLPNEVILHILSFLPLKDAVATRVLSKTWHRPSLVQHLNFSAQHSFPKEADNVQNRSPFEQEDIRAKHSLAFVDRSLQGFCKQQERIKMFSLCMDSYFTDAAPFINKWIKLTADNDFHIIHIRFVSYCPHFILPQPIFASKLLTVLSLVACELEDYSLNDAARLDSLQDLSLELVKLSDKILNRLIFVSPNIRHLSVILCKGIKFLQLLNHGRLEKVVVRDGYGCNDDWFHKIKIEARSFHTFDFYRRCEKDCEIDLKCCKNLEVLRLNAPILPGLFSENLFFDFPLLRSLFLYGQHKLEKFKISSPRLEQLHLFFMENLADATIDTPNLCSFKYTGYDFLPFLFQMNTRCLQKTSFRLYPYRMDVSWFLRLREFIGKQSHNEVLSLQVPNNCMVTFDQEELRGILIPPVHGVKHLKLKLVFDYLSSAFEALIDGILWSCHPEMLTMKLGRKQNKFIKDLKNILQYRQKDQNESCKPRHNLKDVEIEQFTGPPKKKRISQHKMIIFRFKW